MIEGGRREGGGKVKLGGRRKWDKTREEGVKVFNSGAELKLGSYMYSVYSCLETVEWNSGMEYWNDPDRLCSLTLSCACTVCDLSRVCSAAQQSDHFALSLRPSESQKMSH